ncbi:MAG: DNA-protecting protein DprA [Deltaproteobacteria bacterium]|nr:DNA-protecting protein DprA [Deltaproteobacteria bacterium]
MLDDLSLLNLLKIFFTVGLGKKAFHVLYKNLPSASLNLLQDEAWIYAQLEQVPLKEESKRQKILSDYASEEILRRAEKEILWMKERGGKILSFLDPAYPDLLKEIPDAAPLLFTQGKLDTFSTHFPLAFVGTRECSDYGRKVVESFISELQGQNFLIVSGFARGIDTCAHEAALRHNLPTVGVLGTGLDLVYPRENLKLFQPMIERGAFVTQYATETLPQAWNFPERNRLISGLSKGVLLVEVPEKSGALITAKFALEQGREVFAVPGSIFSKNNAGVHRLIQEGAKLVTSISEVLEEFLQFQSLYQFGQAKKTLPSEKSQNKEAGPEGLKNRIAEDLKGSEARLYTCLSEDALHVDQLVEKSGLGSSEAIGILTDLMLRGYVNELPGKFFVKAEN